MMTYRVGDPEQPAVRMVELLADWARYGELAESQWRNEMRRALIIEMRVEVAKLARECGA